MDQDPIQIENIKLEPPDEELAQSPEPESSIDLDTLNENGIVVKEEPQSLDPISDYNFTYVKTEPELQIDDFTKQTYVNNDHDYGKDSSTENRVKKEPEPTEYVELGIKLYFHFKNSNKIPNLDNRLFTITANTATIPNRTEIIQQPNTGNSAEKQQEKKIKAKRKQKYEFNYFHQVIDKSGM